jgi:predicted GNAT superfamily acetyltransferase
LTSVNAHRNIHYFGMDVLDYKESVYGGFGGLFNRADIPLDRFYVSWDLKRTRRRRSGRGEPISGLGPRVVLTERVEVAGKNGPISLEVIKDVRIAPDREILAVDIPADFYRMLNETDVENKDIRRIPLEWRLKTRRVFQDLFEKGYKVIDFRRTEGRTQRNFYVLKKEGR